MDKDFNKIVNDILLEVKPFKLRISIANEICNLIQEKNNQLKELEVKIKNKDEDINKLIFSKQHAKQLCDCISSILDRFNSLKYKEFPNLSRENMVDILVLAIKNYVDIWLLVNE